MVQSKQITLNTSKRIMVQWKNGSGEQKSLHGGKWLNSLYPSKIEWDLTNGPLGKLLELLDTQV